MRGRGFSYLGMLIIVTGCSSVVREDDAAKENREALKSVAGQVTGQPINDQKLRELSQQIEKDPEAKSAVEAVKKGMSGQSRSVKYCPIDGKRFSSKLAECPEHQIPLKEVTP